MKGESNLEILLKKFKPSNEIKNDSKIIKLSENKKEENGASFLNKKMEQIFFEKIKKISYNIIILSDANIQKKVHI